MTHLLRNIIIILIALTIFSTAYYFYDGIYNHSNLKQIDIIYRVKPSSSAKEVAFDLARQNILSDPYPLLAYLFASGNLKNIKAGAYEISSNMTGRQIAEILTNGKTAQLKLTIVEGWDLAKIGAYLQSQNFGTIQDFYNITGKPAEAQNKNAAFHNTLVPQFKFLEDCPAQASLEGFLFPDTYYVSIDASLENIVTQMLINFDNKLTPQMREDIKKQNKSIYEIVTMASILEKEVKTLDDKKIVAGILWKRLRNGQPLQADATILYALQIQNPDNIYTKFTEIDSPYNTYKYKGLPIGPISNPGLDSLIAAIYPAPSDYWYYLSKPSGETVYSKNFTEHVIAKNKYLN
ncbi:MAG TPA: endolytic transglycosylase MltG [Candidatus Pacearchaeota archaeon]|nr:endolytic transglycosylase MltG [Candidatus Pacearchaeota archaeon]HRR94620.1 endolytic transglycosylase MltG [Candidatus Paceibacterota bacterium]HPC30326.1 endolytic transglycosylase MltG [Candidatus Pacearchaeota archaeon]HQG09016.1 endolytic transglycosylase MltG [Candidatus Pacearchaeota archaeon]HQH19997.1 endolytic transglycosylase MltG [Candidatus Pacearchaeota archaeon]